METDWSGSGWDEGLDPTAAGEIQSAIDTAAGIPIPEAGLIAPEAADPGWDASQGWGPVTGDGEDPSAGGNHALSEKEAAELLVDILSKSPVYVEEGTLKVEPDPAEIERWDAQKRQDASDIIGQVTGRPENAQLVADALELENARLDALMVEYEETVAQAGNDEDAEVVALAQEIQDLHAKIQDLTEQYIHLEGLPVPHMRGPHSDL